MNSDLCFLILDNNFIQIYSENKKKMSYPFNPNHVILHVLNRSAFEI